VSEGEAGPTPVPLTPSQPKTFEVWWTDDNLDITNFSGITGSHLDGDLLFLMTPDGKERLVNLAHARMVYIWNDE
jgi:hypothetical protein